MTRDPSYDGDVPVESEADWYQTVVAPARKGFERAGVSVADLTDSQVIDASTRILEEFAGETPDLVQIARIVDETRRAEGAGVHFSPGPSAHHPRSKDCQVCSPIKMPYPSGWWLVHSKFCPATPMEKIRRLESRADRRQSAQLRMSHEAEDARSGVVFTWRISACEKCGVPTSRGLYCKACRSLLDIVREARR